LRGKRGNQQGCLNRKKHRNTFATDLANRRLQPLGHVSGQVIQLASPSPAGNKASIAACLPPFCIRTLGLRRFLANRKDTEGA
jgi:hypothetical protein